MHPLTLTPTSAEYFRLGSQVVGTFLSTGQNVMVLSITPIMQQKGQMLFRALRLNGCCVVESVVEFCMGHVFVSDIPVADAVSIKYCDSTCKPDNTSSEDHKP
jgi:hypothetical protein